MALRILFLSLLLLYITEQAIGQKTDELDRVAMEEDLAKLESHLLKIHPGLNYYSSTRNMPGLFETIRNNLPDQMTPIDFLMHIAPIIDSVKCGHTGFNIETGEKTFGLFQKDIEGLFPFQLMAVEGAVLIKRNFSEDTLLVRDNMRLLKIDGQEITTILQRLSNLQLGSDGDNKTGEIHFALKYFMLAYKMFYGHKDDFVISLENLEDNSIHEVKISSGTLKSLREVRLERYPAKAKPPIQIQKVEGFPHIAVIDVNTFSNTRWDFLQFGYRRKIKKIFKVVESEEFEYLIVDVRDNPGGVVQNVVDLMKYTYDSPFVLSEEVELNRDYFKSEVGFFDKLGMLFRRRSKKENHIKLKGFSGKKYKPKKRHRYNKNMIILINEGSFSAACTYALFAKSFNRAIIVGEEAGGSYHIVSAGDSHNCTLENADLTVRIPIMKFEYNVDPNKQSNLRGLLPHIPASISIEDHLNGVDSQLEAAINLIKMHQERKK